MAGDKPRQLQHILWEVQRHWGQCALRIADAEPNSGQPTSIRTGFAQLDAMLAAKGIAQGHVTTLLGVPTAGMTTLAHRITANAQGVEGVAAYLDLSGTLDPDYAARCGVALERLLVVRPHQFTHALELAHDLVSADSTALVVLDALGIEQATHLSQTFHRLHHKLVRSRCALLLLLPALGGGTLSSFTHTYLRLERQAWLHHRRDVRGYRTQITVLKDNPDTGQKQVTIELALATGVEGGEG